ncbi:MAG: hypothetical protein HY665_01105 [Chloroflexi bacterium]|nr:hypothetical protein [Chloroflexota bacterium]
MIYVECKPDFTLVKFVTRLPTDEISHEFKGKSGVCMQLATHKNSKGLVDEDPWALQPRYVREAELEYDLPKLGLRLLHDTARNNHLIVLRPRLEEWILAASKEARIDVRSYELPSSGESLHRHINIRLGRFEHLLEALMHSSNRLKTLRRLFERG